jgi:protocatechuate 3,4-dioxygenase beta subunit
MPFAETDRRALLRALALLPLGLGSRMPAWAEGAAADAGLIAANVCVLSPETTAGPFYVDPRLVRRDIREGRPGVPLDLALQVVDADCRPIPEARVDVWHCDAAGDYSGFARQGSRSTAGETFLRGTQATAADGVARFRTIWPGWYRGRTPHVHFKVFLDDRTALTSQLFFPDGISDRIYRAVPAYAGRGAADTTNARDGIARRAGRAAVARASGTSAGMEAALVVGIDAEVVG